MSGNKISLNSITKVAKELAAIEKRGGPIPTKFDFSVQAICASCLKDILPPKKSMRCSRCKAVIYCSSECAKRAWSHPALPNHPTHKMLCGDNKRHMEKLPQTQAITKSFPWGRLESDGSFNFDIARGRYEVLGISGYGFWSHQGGLSVRSAAVMGFEHLDGEDLLGNNHLSDEEGWKLPSTLIPHRIFLSPATQPEIVTAFEKGIVDWDSWYRWRKLPKESPAALLMNYPMTVYQIVVNCLELTSINAGKPGQRIALHLHLLGARSELNYLPLYSELALLLPHHDIKLVLFGAAVTRLVKAAKKCPGSLASGFPVFTYTAPPGCGSGTVSIYLNSVAENWSATAHNIPDAIIGCNAGLGSYPEWLPVIQTAHLRSIPFATTEYAEQSAEHQRNAMPVMLAGTRAVPRPLDEYEIQLNPFQRPGQRQMPMYRLPNAVNGFTLVVCKNKDIKAGVIEDGTVGQESGLTTLMTKRFMKFEELD